MKKITIIGLFLALAGMSLSGCSNTETAKAEKMIAKACPRIMKDDSNIFLVGQAAMINPKWLPLAEAASFFRLNKDTPEAITDSNIRLELQKSQSIIFTYCSNYINSQ